MANVSTFLLRVTRAVTTSGVLVMMLVGGPALAQYPERPITLITPYAAGGSHDLNARVFTTYIQRYLDQPVVIKLVPGQAGQKGTLEAVQAPPDGYTLIFTDNYRDQLYQHTFRNRHYDTTADLISVARVNYGQVGLIVRGDSPYQTWQDFEADARARPGELKMSHSGLWAAFFVTAGQVMKDRGIRLRLVPYRGGGPAKAALLGGDVDISAGFPSSLVADVEAGVIRILATAGSERTIEDVPSFAELGISASAGFMHRAVMAPRATPADRIARLRAAFAELQDDPDYKAAMAQMGENTEYLDGEAYEDERRALGNEYAELAAAIAAL
ncbi:MAG: tripartite tricarboxylate transporter substrate binding protein [Gammaproteobacteria bacterium]|nr:tripartite tricarboxylate transporter substrate binding protein [Gammaproteobacteria bacterium]MDH3506494.1 tripartite tricarboxylate transporter substrate binding protein [Gammaproteobacteria bacterium]